MKYRFLFTTLMVFTMFQTSVVCADEHLENVEKALDLIGDFAEEICQRVPLESSNNEFSLTARLPKLLNKLTSFGIDIESIYKIESSKGVLQKDLTEAIRDSNNCRLKVLEILEGPLIGDTGGHAGRSGDQPKYGNGKNREREERVKGITSSLSNMDKYDVDDFLIKVIPKIDGGVSCREFSIMLEKSDEYDRHSVIEKVACYIHRTLPASCLDTLSALVEEYDTDEAIEALINGQCKR